MICIFRERGKGRVKPAAGEMIYEKAATASVNGYRDRRGRTALNGFRKEMLIIWLQAPRCSASVFQSGFLILCTHVDHLLLYHLACGHIA